MDIFNDERYGLTTKHCRVILPTAPKKPTTLNDGAVLHTWFDITKMDHTIYPNVPDIWALYN